MDLSLFVLDLVPLLVFVVLDSIGNVRLAVIGAMLAAALELGYSYWALGGIDLFSVIFAALILFFAGLSYKFNNPLFFKLKPVAIGALSGIIFLTTSVFFTPILLTLIDRYIELIPLQHQHKLQNPTVRLMLADFNLYLGFTFLLHAGITAWAALRLSRWGWFAISGPGLYAVIFLAALLVIP